MESDQNAGGPTWTGQQICHALDVGVATVERLRKRFVEAGLDAALNRRTNQHLQLRRNVDEHHEVQLVVLTCSPPPEGWNYWSLRLLADTLVELEVVDSISYQTVMVVPLKHHEQYEELPSKLRLHLNLMVQRCVLLLRKTYNPRGFKIGQNQGKWGGASIPHLHIHVVPRYGVDLNFREIIGGTRVVVEPLADTLQNLQAQVDLLHLNM